jgi:lactoylglutathione lyase
VPAIAHIAVWTLDLEATAAFYATWLRASVGERYANPRTGFTSRFLAFAGGAQIELMARPDVGPAPAGERLGWAHVAFTVGDEGAVDALTAAMARAGVPVVSGPRRTGDGYYESCVLDPEGNRLELVALRP